MLYLTEAIDEACVTNLAKFGDHDLVDVSKEGVQLEGEGEGGGLEDLPLAQSVCCVRVCVYAASGGGGGGAASGGMHGLHGDAGQAGWWGSCGSSSSRAVVESPPVRSGAAPPLPHAVCSLSLAVPAAAARPTPPLHPCTNH